MLKAVEEHAHEPVEQVALGRNMAVSGFTPAVAVGSGSGELRREEKAHR